MRTVRIFFFGHLAALIFGLGGLLVALPHPELWNTNPDAAQVFNFGISYAGSLHILFGAATMLLFGLLFVGPRKTLTFFAASTAISLGMELMGTSTGFPFGAYSYSDLLGFKIADRVPYSIPLSWFYMGFTSLILASIIVSRWKLPHCTAWSLVVGAYFLTVWDLALDPSMASQYLPLHFWTWHETGPYFGMPIRNLVGWTLTGLAFMSISRLFWRTNLDSQRIPVWLPLSMYTVNIGFAIALNLSARLWLPPLMAVTFGLLPASLTFLPLLNMKRSRSAGINSPVIRSISQVIVCQGSRAMVHHNVKLTVEGLEYVPSSGPVLIVARHFHHLYDGCVLLKAITRPLHVIVALDWVKYRWLRKVMELACTLVGWPTILRVERLSANTERSICQKKVSAYSPDEVRGYLRRAARDAVQLLRNGEVLLVFPEAYPNIDPVFTPKHSNDTFLPFRSGFTQLVRMAERDGSTQVAIVPAGLTYVHKDRWHVTLRFGPPILREDYTGRDHLLQAIEKQVHELSDQTIGPIFPHSEEAAQL